MPATPPGPSTPPPPGSPTAGPTFTPAPYVPGAGAGEDNGSWAKRAGRGEWATWWREIDRVLLVLIFALMGIGALAVAAGSPAAVHAPAMARKGFGDLHFFYLHIGFQSVGLIAMLVCSRLNREQARRVGIMLGAAMLVALMLVPVIGANINGAKRWLKLGITIQPSEFLKPAFAICLAWVLSWKLRDGKLPVMMICVGLTGLVAMLLMLQPDFGSTVLFLLVGFTMLLVAGLPMSPPMIGISLAGCAGVVGLAYTFYGNARNRIDDFLLNLSGGGDQYDQVHLAFRTLVAGGWTGTGLWLGSQKKSLPEPHTDYIFSVIGEEFGLLMCAVVVLLYFAIVARVLIRLAQEEDLFTVLAGTGLVVQIGGQAFINILVNLQLFPSKGMTLPLISYGGSSTIALCIGVGFLLAITRRNPYLAHDPFQSEGKGLPLHLVSPFSTAYPSKTDNPRK